MECWLQALQSPSLTAVLLLSPPMDPKPLRRLLPGSLPPQRLPQEEEDSLTALSAPSLPTGVSLPRRLHLPPDSLPPQRLHQEEGSLTAPSALNLPTGVSLPGGLHPSRPPPQGHRLGRDSLTALPPHPLQASSFFLCHYVTAKL